LAKLLGKYTARELLASDLVTSKPLIDGLLYEDDAVILVGREKSNKSTLAMQMCVALSSGQSLFNTFSIPRQVPSVYIQAEGKLSSTKSNLQNMLLARDCDPDNILFLYYPRIPLNQHDGLKRVIDDIDSWDRQPRLIIPDPLYHCMHGSLKDDERAREMTGNMRVLASRYQSAIMIVHHCHTVKRMPDGKIVDEGDNSIFGSFVWKAFPDSVFMIQKVQGNKNFRKFYCDTQRSGDIVTGLDLLLVEPSPYFLALRDESPIRKLIFAVLKPDIGITSQELADLIKRSRRHVSTELNEMFAENMVSFSEIEKNKRLWVKKL